MILPADARHLDDIRAIFREYATWVGDAICFAAFETELATLPGRYSPILLAWQQNQIAACAALRELSPGIGEMKRLYVRPQYRRLGLGRAMTERVIAESRAAGHKLLRLDTLPKMQQAFMLYHSLGFREIPRYGDNPATAICFELTL